MSGSLRSLFAPASIAVVGASRRPGSIGGAIVDNLVRSGFSGRIVPVNPHAETVAGLPAVASIAEAPAPIELAVIAVPAALVEQVVRECARAQIAVAVIITAGFAEVSADGRAAQDRIVAVATAANMRVVGPNCLGVLDTRSRLNASFAASWPPAGNIAIASQSGAIAIAMIDQAASRGLGLASLISIGNRADVSNNDLIEYWADDPGVEVIALYLESFGNPSRFARIARATAKRKPIVALKSGRSAAGKRAASSHTAALATTDTAVDALLASAGVIRVTTMVELFDVVQLLSSQPAPRGSRVGIVSNAGGPAILLTDACSANELVVPSLTSDTREALRAILPAAATVDNPVDLTAGAPADHFARSLAIVGCDPQIDAVVALYVPPHVTEPREIAAAIATGAGQVPRDRPVATVFMAPGPVPDELSAGERGRLPAYGFPENVAAALAHAARHARWRERPDGHRLELPATALDRVRALVAGRPGGWVLGRDALAIVEAIGVPVVRTEVVDPELAAVTAAAARIGYPIVVKAVAPGIVHKTEIGGVIAGISSPAELASVVETLSSRTASAGSILERIVVQQHVRSGVEMLVGMSRDAVLGPVIAAGLGGVNVELLHDVAFRLPPITDVDARDMLAGLRAAPMLDGYRGAPRADRPALELAIQLLSALSDIPEISELEVNPLFVLPAGSGVLSIDARVRLAG